MHPHGGMSWVKNIVSAVKWLKRNNISLVSSCGMQTWEMVTAVASLNNIEQTIVVPAASESDFESLKAYLTDQFALDTSRVDFIPLIYDTLSQKERQVLRDEKVVEACDILIPVSIKENGNMAKLLTQALGKNKNVVTSFKTEYVKKEQPLAYKIDISQLNPKIKMIKNEYVVHWTRSANSAWPDERLIDYYRAVINSREYPRDAFSALMNIIESRCIKSSKKNMPGKVSAISFTGLSPVEVIPLMKWRARYRQMSFEPYGIGIKREYGLKLGIKPVLYYDKKEDLPKTVLMWLTQSIGKFTDWRNEKEFRYLCDFHLEDIPENRLVLFTYTKEEACFLENKTGITTVSFLS